MGKTIKATHSGNVPQAVRVVGGTVTVWPGKTTEIVDMVPLTDEQADHFKQMGVTFDDGKPKKSAAEKAAADIAAAEKAVSDARAKLAEAGDDLAAKAEAEKELAAAETKLAALKA